MQLCDTTINYSTIIIDQREEPWKKEGREYGNQGNGRRQKQERLGLQGLERRGGCICHGCSIPWNCARVARFLLWWTTTGLEMTARYEDFRGNMSVRIAFVARGSLLHVDLGSPWLPVSPKKTHSLSCCKSIPSFGKRACARCLPTTREVSRTKRCKNAIYRDELRYAWTLFSGNILHVKT